MIWRVQPLMLNAADDAFGQVIAVTPNCAALSAGLTRAINVVMCMVPVEPMSTSASSLPSTSLLGCCRSASTRPRKVGADPNGPVHR